MSLTTIDDSRLSTPAWLDKVIARDDGFDVVPLFDGRSRVRLWGRLAPGWCGSFSLGLSWAGVNILRGFARKIAPGRWGAEFQVQSSTGHDTGSLDYLALARDRPPYATTVPIALDSYRLAVSGEFNESLSLEVHGPDCVGFLGSLLECLTRLSLFPEEMAIETHDGQVSDRFLVKATGGRPPSEEVRRALGVLLDGLTHPTSAPAAATNDAGL